MPTTIYTSIDLARAIRAARHERGLTQDDLALVSGTGRRFIGDLERGKATLRLSSVLTVVAALGLRLELHPDPPELDGRDAGA